MTYWRLATLDYRLDFLVDHDHRHAFLTQRARGSHQISSRISGARPSVASSRISSAGLVSSARPIASICCSPPDSKLPGLCQRSLQARKQLAAHGPGSTRHARRRCLRAATSRFSRTVRFGKIRRPSGTRPMPRREMRVRRRRSMRSSSNLISPRVAGRYPRWY